MTPFSTKLFLSILFSALLAPAIAQVTFDKGYIIDKDGKKIECLIENKDRTVTPLNFKYKLFEDEHLQQASVNDVKEVEIYNYSHYVSATVQMDTSGSVIYRYSPSKAPEWRKKTIFLKVLTEGKATLYYYESIDFIRFFFKTEANPSIRQLVYKEYRTSDLSIGENVTFRQQLLVEVNCGNMRKSHFEQMNYRMDELKKHFIKYNACMGGGEVTKTEVQNAPYVKRDVFNFSIAPGFNFSSFSVRNSKYPGYDVDLDGGSYFRLGLQMEYVFPFNRNKWSFFIEPTTQAYHGSSEYYNKGGTTRTATADYSSIEFPVGFRYYMYLKGGAKIFLTGFSLPVAATLSKPALVYNTTGGTLTISLAPDVVVGAGMGISGRVVSAELRYYGRADLAANDADFIASYNRTALIVAFRILSIKK